MEKDFNEFCLEKENRYRNRDPRNFILFGEPRSLYWYRYRKTYELLRNDLKVGGKVYSPIKLKESIPSDILLSKFCVDERYNLFNLPIVMVGNNNLTPFTFDIRKRDRSVIDGLDFPGISATIGFSDNLAETCGGIFDRDCRRQDRMYCTTVGQIEECNYSVYYLPTENQPLHVRLVHDIHEVSPLEHLPPFKDRELLAETFTNGKCLE
jgi:hypothetical protein